MTLPPGYTKIEPPILSQQIDSTGILHTRVLRDGKCIEVFKDEAGIGITERRRNEITHRIQVQLNQLLSNPDSIPLENIRPIKKTSYRANSEPSPEPRSAQASDSGPASEPSPQQRSPEERSRYYREAMEESEAEELQPSLGLKRSSAKPT